MTHRHDSICLVLIPEITGEQILSTTGPDLVANVGLGQKRANSLVNDEVACPACASDTSHVHVVLRNANTGAS
eukprot:CAMPEP_0184683674 /NCGR_PEP_ID=MMETSP0312-20130426/12099_1 /TAXON_ID=31354 /ORGANISM="Compsopogon coeruleus, Strain SAG 36.94" /LENGTH=72 /DNA_ID=CAMNT_0027136175 /DNA_START=612 /DNA_END=830 /DNA_ORIENTATION=-